MLSAFLMILLMVVAFVVFGSLGGMVGERLERSGTGQNVAVALSVIFGGIGVALAIWIVGLLIEK